MVAALNVLCLYAASALPVGRIPFLFLASVFICILTSEKAYLSALIAYAASGILAYWFVPDKLPALAYIMLLGHYGITRAALKRMQSRLLPALIKLFYCDIFAAAGLYLLYVVFAQSLPLPAAIPVWVLVLVAQVAFILYDVLYGACEAIYQSKFQRIIMPRR